MNVWAERVEGRGRQDVPTLPACVQKESWTEEKVSFALSQASAVMIMWQASRE